MKGQQHARVQYVEVNRGKGGVCGGLLHMCYEMACDLLYVDAKDEGRVFCAQIVLKGFWR